MTSTEVSIEEMQTNGRLRFSFIYHIQSDGLLEGKSLQADDYTIVRMHAHKHTHTLNYKATINNRKV